MPVRSPFLRSGSRSSGMAAWTLLALLVPCALYSWIYDSAFVFHLMGYALLGMAAESLYTLLIRRRMTFIHPGSALTAALIAASVPVSMPFHAMCLAILVAVWIVKLPMTGFPLRFNAAMAGRFFLMMAYPAQVVAWGTPTPDVISTATPQELYRSEGFMIQWQELLFGRIDGTWEGLFLLVPGSPGEIFPLITLGLGVLLWRKGILGWRTPLAFLVSFSITTALCGNSLWFNLLSAATLFSAVFIVSDPVSTPMSNGARIACGIVIGISNGLIRHFTYYTEAIVYAVLIGNCCAPLLDRIAFSLRGLQLKRQMDRAAG